MKLRHYDHDGRARFVTFCTHRKLPLLTNNEFRRAVIDSIRQIRNDYQIKLISYVIMPEHVHLVLIPGLEVKLGEVIGILKRGSSHQIRRLAANNESLLNKLTITRDKERRFVFWQRRCYDHNCRTDESLWSTVDYCHNNPVKRGLVSRPADWIWSSCRWYKGYSDAVLEMDFSELML